MHKSKLVAAVIDCQIDDLTEATRLERRAGRKVSPSEDPGKDKYVRLGSGKEELITSRMRSDARRERYFQAPPALAVLVELLDFLRLDAG
jgi:hypothetical protein